MSITDNLRELAIKVKKYNDNELNERILALREEVQELYEENFSLKEHLQQLRAAADVAGQIERIGNCYYFKDDVEHKNPYCLTCWDADKKLISLTLNNSHFGTQIRCGICSSRK